MLFFIDKTEYNSLEVKLSINIYLQKLIRWWSRACKSLFTLLSFFTISFHELVIASVNWVHWKYISPVKLNSIFKLSPSLKLSKWKINLLGDFRKSTGLFSNFEYLACHKNWERMQDNVFGGKDSFFLNLNL